MTLTLLCVAGASARVPKGQPPVSDEASPNFVAAEQTPPDEGGETPFVIVEQMPLFEGGEVNNFVRWVAKRLVYPPEFADIGLQGRIIVRFTIKKDGQLDDIEVVRSLHPLLDQMVVDAVGESPRWTPGRQYNKPVAVRFTMPVNISTNNYDE